MLTDVDPSYRWRLGLLPFSVPFREAIYDSWSPPTLKQNRLKVIPHIPVSCTLHVVLIFSQFGSIPTMYSSSDIHFKNAKLPFSPVPLHSSTAWSHTHLQKRLNTHRLPEGGRGTHYFCLAFSPQNYFTLVPVVFTQHEEVNSSFLVVHGVPCCP